MSLDDQYGPGAEGADAFASVEHKKAKILDMQVWEIMPERLNWKNGTRSGAETVHRMMVADTLIGRYYSKYDGDGDFVAGGPTLDHQLRTYSVDDGVRVINDHYESLMNQYSRD